MRHSIALAVLLISAFAQTSTTASEPPDRHLLLIRTEEGYGYIAPTGEVAIAPRFEWAGEFREGLAPVMICDHEGFIDQSGEVVIAAQFLLAHQFSEGLAPVLHSMGYGFVDKKGNIVIPAKFEDVGDFREGLAVVKGEQWGYIDTKGNVAIPLQFDWAGDFSGGRAVVSLEEDWYVIDRSGTILFRTGKDPSVAPGYSEGLLFTKIGDKFGYLDAKGELVIPARFDEVSPFSEGLAAVRIGSQSGWIDRSGKMVLTSDFESVGNFSEGLAPVRSGTQWGYADRSGNLVIPNRYGGFSFHGGVARVSTEDGFAYINTKGEFLWGPTKYVPDERPNIYIVGNEWSLWRNHPPTRCTSLPDLESQRVPSRP